MSQPPTTLIELLAASDEDLARSSTRDSAAFAELYHRHFTRIYRYLYATTGNVKDAQDLTTQTFMAALEGIGGYRGEASVKSWLFGIARNKAALLYRSRRREVPLTDETDLADTAPSPETAVGRRLQLAQIVQALNRLTPERAEAIVLYLFGNLSASEAGRVMNKSEAAVRMLVQRGLRDLRQQLLPLQEVEL